MPDVAQKIFASRPTYNGSVVVGTDKQGSSQILRPYLVTSSNAPSASGLAGYLDRRFDDPTYYTA